MTEEQLQAIEAGVDLMEYMQEPCGTNDTRILIDEVRRLQDKIACVMPQNSRRTLDASSLSTRSSRSSSGNK